MSSTLHSLALLAFLTSSAAIATSPFAPPDNVSSRLQVQVPKNLFKDGGYDHREALFGTPPYGGSISQNIYYADSDLCDPTQVDSRSGYPSRPTDDDGDMKPWPSPFILMVDRGTCSFVQKVRNAQHAGAAAVVIADNLCLCSDRACMSESGSDNCQNNEPIMADDGSGGDITIPAFLMFKTDAQSIISTVKEDQAVQMEMSWSMPNPDNDVEYDLFTVPSEDVSKDFQKSWKTIAKKMGNKIVFTPHQFIYDGVKSNCHTEDGKNLCYNLCTNNGRYCATDPDNDLDAGISGADVVRESLKRICIWKEYGEKDGIGLQYWNYISAFLDECDQPKFFSSEKCFKYAAKKAKVNVKKIEKCIENSGGTSDSSDINDKNINDLLEDQITAQLDKGVVILPTMFVNSVPLRGALSTYSVFNAICAGFYEGTAPKLCQTCSGCSDVETCVSKGRCTSGGASGDVGGGGVSKRTFGLTLLFLCSAFGAAGYLHWRKTREEMRDQVRGILAEYMPLEGGDDVDGSPMDFARQGQRTSLIS